MPEWFFQDPPAPWLWLGIFIGIAGFVLAVMALPSVFQMMFGKPDLFVEFKSAELEEVKVLQCLISNRPINSRMLRWLGVSRQSTHLTASISIYERGTKKPIREHAKLLINQGGEKSVEIGEITSAWPVVVAPFSQKPGAPVYLNDDFDLLQISPGYYTVELALIGENRQIVLAESGVRIGAKMNELYWT